MSYYKRKPYEAPKWLGGEEAVQWDGTEAGMVAVRKWIGERWSAVAVSSVMAVLTHAETLETWLMVSDRPGSGEWARVLPQGWIRELVPGDYLAYLNVMTDEEFRDAYEVQP